MKLVGFNFTKISAERANEIKENLSFNTKIDIPSISSFKTEFFKTKEDIFSVEFVYTISYSKDFAKIEMKGNMLLSAEPKIVKDILKNWDDKKILDDYRFFFFNIILKKANIKALQLEEELNLPTHIPLPSIKKESLKKED